MGPSALVPCRLALLVREMVPALAVLHEVLRSVHARVVLGAVHRGEPFVTLEHVLRVMHLCGVRSGRSRVYRGRNNRSTTF